MRKKFAIIFGALVFMATASVGTYHLARDWKFNSDAPIAQFDPPQDLAEARQQDLEHFSLFFDLENSFTPETRTRALALYRDLQKTAPSMSDAAFDLAIARIVAVADNPHTKVREYGRTPRYNRLPVRGYWFSDGYYIIRAREGFEETLGKRVVAIEGRPFEEATAGIRQYIGGIEGTFRKYAPYILESPELMHAAGFAASPDAMTIQLEDADGALQTITFEAPFPPSEEHLARGYLLLAPDTYKISQREWSGISIEGHSLPLYLQAPIEQFQKKEIPELSAYYVQFWTNNDTGDQSISDFCEGAFQAYKASRAKNLIVDHRFNGGGNYEKTADCMEEFAKLAKQRGKIFVITGGATFSAGIYSAAILKHFSGSKAIFVGENVGDKLTAWGEDNLLLLPNSGIEIKFSTGFHNLRDGCTDWSICEWGSIGHPYRIESFEPDIPAPLTFADYAAGRDPAMEAIKAFGE